MADEKTETHERPGGGTETTKTTHSESKNDNGSLISTTTETTTATAAANQKRLAGVTRGRVRGDKYHGLKPMAGEPPADCPSGTQKPRRTDHLVSRRDNQRSALFSYGLKTVLLFTGERTKTSPTHL